MLVSSDFGFDKKWARRFGCGPFGRDSAVKSSDLGRVLGEFVWRPARCDYVGGAWARLVRTLHTGARKFASQTVCSRVRVAGLCRPAGHGFSHLAVLNGRGSWPAAGPLPHSRPPPAYSDSLGENPLPAVRTNSRLRVMTSRNLCPTSLTDSASVIMGPLPHYQWASSVRHCVQTLSNNITVNYPRARAHENRGRIMRRRFSRAVIRTSDARL